MWIRVWGRGLRVDRARGFEGAFGVSLGSERTGGFRV